MNRHFLHPATLFFLLTLVVALLSWVGSIYGWSGVQSLLSAEGLRWQLRNVGDGFFSAPFFSDILLLAFGVGLCMHSGFWEAVRRAIFHGRKLSRKEKRSLLLSLTVGAVYILAVLCLALGPWGIVRSITGGLKNSPLSEGVSYLLSLGLGIMAIIYGYSIDLYRTDRDIIRVCRIALSVFLAIVLHCFCDTAVYIPALYRIGFFFRAFLRRIYYTLCLVLYSSTICWRK